MTKGRKKKDKLLSWLSWLSGTVTTRPLGVENNDNGEQSEQTT
jgi:hypothetical protein